MKGSKLVFFLIATFICSLMSVNAQTAKRKINIKNNKPNTGSRSIVPIEASIMNNTLYVSFVRPIGEVTVVVRSVEGDEVYNEKMSVLAPEALPILMEVYGKGEYEIEFLFADGSNGFYGEFVLE